MGKRIEIDPVLLAGSSITSLWRDPRKAMTAADFGKPDSHLPILLYREVVEAFEAYLLVIQQLDRGELSRELLIEFQKEIADTLVILYSYCIRHGIKLDFQGVQSRVNGQGNRSDVYDVLSEIALNLNEGNIVINAHAFLTYVLSLSLHIPEGPMHVDKTMKLVTDKNTANRHKKYYSEIGTRGEKLSRDELVLRYDHSEKCLRIIRDYYRSTLKAWMHNPHSDLILDFRNSESNIALLRRRLEDSNRILNSTIATHLRNAIQLKSGSIFESQLKAVGAVPIAKPTLN